MTDTDLCDRTRREATRSADAAPIVALHCSAASGRRMRPLLEALSQGSAFARRAHAPDLPGYGEARAARPAPERGVEALAEAVAPALEATGRPAHLIGHSFGGAVALSLTRHRPELVASLTLYEPTLFHLLAGSPHPRDALLLSGVRTVSARLSVAIAQNRPEDGMAGFVDFWNGAGVWDRADSGLRALLAAEARCVAADFAAGEAERWRLDDLGLDRPLLILSGLSSPQIARRVATMLAAAAEGARLDLMPGLGHMAPLTEPGLLAPRIAAHLDAVERRAGPSHHPSR